MRVFLVGMPGAGNLGDDLISVMLVQHICDRWPDAEIGVLNAGHPIPFAYPNPSQIRFFRIPQRRSWSKLVGRSRAISRFIREADLILIGGGGLFQDSHYRFTVHKWMRHALNSSLHRVPAAAVGVGFGPFSHAFSLWYLTKSLARLSVIQVRDNGSSNIVNSLGHVAQIAPDIVAGTSLAQTPFVKTIEKSQRSTLGCSIRPWPGLKLDALIRLIANVSYSKQMDVSLFVFEHAEPDNTSEYLYALKIAEALKERQISVEVFCYGKQSINAFADAFNKVSMAIATRFHANILWQKLGVPVLPISYAPKVDRFYEERGGKVIHVDSIPDSIPDDCFQKFELKEQFSLPSDDELFAQVNYRPWSLFLLAKAVDLLETIYGLAQSVSWRLRRLR